MWAGRTQVVQGLEERLRSLEEAILLQTAFDSSCSVSSSWVCSPATWPAPWISDLPATQSRSSPSKCSSLLESHD